VKRRLYAAAILGGLGVLVAVAVAVFAFGRNNPSPPSLQDAPNTAIPGEVLFLDSHYCFVQASASGQSRSKRACIPQDYVAPGLFWTTDDTAELVRYDQRGGGLWEVDLNTGSWRDTGRLVDMRLARPGPAGIEGGNYAPDGTYAIAEQDGSLFVLQNGVRTRIATFDTPNYNPPRVILWSPDSQWILLEYHPRRAEFPELWIVSRDGETKGTLAKNVLSVGAAWRMVGLPAQPPAP
jgi:hypothetical protein